MPHQGIVGPIISCWQEIVCCTTLPQDGFRAWHPPIWETSVQVCVLFVSFALPPGLEMVAGPGRTHVSRTPEHVSVIPTGFSPGLKHLPSSENDFHPWLPRAVFCKCYCCVLSIINVVHNFVVVLYLYVLGRSSLRQTFIASVLADWWRTRQYKLAFNFNTHFPRKSLSSYREGSSDVMCQRPTVWATESVACFLCVTC